MSSVCSYLSVSIADKTPFPKRIKQHRRNLKEKKIVEVHRGSVLEVSQR
jgi:hypothetical protein